MQRFAGGKRNVRGLTSPLLLKIMLDKEQIVTWVNEFLEGTDRFLVDVSIKFNDSIMVFLDADSGLTIDHCAEVSKMIEAKLDRDEEDFELRVSSAGLDHPFQLLRQYKKNIGKRIKVELTDGTAHTGNLLQADESALTLEPIIEKKLNKIKIQQTGEPITIAMSDIKEAKPVIVFH